MTDDPAGVPPPQDSPDSPDVAQLLADIGTGAATPEQLLPLVYEELRRIAGSKMQQERGDHTLQATALVHEAYVRLMGQTQLTFHSRAHFFATAARAMRQVLIDSARRRQTQKRGGDWQRVTIDPLFAGLDQLEVLAVDEALLELAEADPRSALVVEYRVFGGMSIELAASMLDVSHATIERDWASARAWLLARLGTSRGAS